jgi:hypothetical protein
MSLVILHHLLNVSVQLANKRGFKHKKKQKHELQNPHGYYYILIWQDPDKIIIKCKIILGAVPHNPKMTY